MRKFFEIKLEKKSSFKFKILGKRNCKEISTII